MSEDTVRIVTYEPVTPPAKSGQSNNAKSLDTMMNPTGYSMFDTQNQSQDTSQSSADEAIGEFKIQEVPKEALKAGMNQLMDAVEELMTQMDRKTDTSEIKLDEVELSVVVNGQGKFSLWGTGVTAGSTGGIKLKFKRQNLK